MQFIATGPDIPDSLLQAHEEGRVVFFCGAGISYPAGLPDFKRLVDRIYRLAGTRKFDIEKAAYRGDRFDTTLDLLEQRLPGQRLAVRQFLTSALKPKLRRTGAADSHAALLRLARTRDGTLRLVTTNFDRIFEWVIKRDNLSVNTYVAPMLPIPKNSRWNGLVYLHGLLPESADDSALHRLVLTSGDFGLAYLTERWAARFVSELFRNYVVCFVGYSINDPVLRYMMDALAADRRLGEATPQAYALADCKPRQEATQKIEWEAKGVVPILYEVPPGSNDHSTLHRTLKVWSETYRDGISGKERIVVDYALARPSASTQQDDFVGRMLWAMSDPSGVPAKRFAEHNPAPPLEWLEAFSGERYQQRDLDRFGILSGVEPDSKLRFSLIRRPTPHTRAPWMSLVSGGGTNSQWDAVMFQLARWLLRHMNDPSLIIWLAERGGQLHDRWAFLIEQELDGFARLEQAGNTAELAELHTNSPNAIPHPLMQKLWRLPLTGRLKSHGRALDLYRCKARLNREGLTATLRLQLRELLAPKVVLQKPFRWGESDEEAAPPVRLEQLVHWELVLATDSVHSWLCDRPQTERWRHALPLLLDDFQQLLRDALDLRRELGGADENHDYSHRDLPSISPHSQNRRFRSWIILIELLRDAWLATHETDPEQATRIAQQWFFLPYPTFKRLALFAASHDRCIAGDQWVDWLKADGTWWLWSVDTQRETMRLLVLQSAQLLPEARTRLEAAILDGPPRAMFRDDLEPSEWKDLVDRSVWLRLAKLKEGGSLLGAVAVRQFEELSAANPDWELAGNQRDEFPIWTSGSGDPDYEDSRVIEIAPRNWQDLVVWLRQRAFLPRQPFHEDTWLETCRKRPLLSLYALCQLSQEGTWPADRWRHALQAWTEKGRTLRSWRFAAPLVQSMPDEVLQEIAHTVTLWLQSVSGSLDRHEIIFLNLCRRILSLLYKDSGDADDPVFQAINHPIGHVTEALMEFWFKRNPNDNDTLPEDVEPLFTQLCDSRVEQFRHGRVLLASRLIALFRVDRSWTEMHLLPLFDWAANPAEAKAVWEGFLWSPRLYAPLLIAFKEQFLSTTRHYTELGKHGQQFATFLTFAALDPVDSYSFQDFRSAIEYLPQEGLQFAAQALVQALEAEEEQREDYWKNRVQPFWQQVWPKSLELVSPRIAELLARLSIAAGGEFRTALSVVLDWLRPIEYPGYVVLKLSESGLAGRFPEDALRLLTAILDYQSQPLGDLKQCLNAIAEAAPALEQDFRYQRLIQYLRQHGC